MKPQLLISICTIDRQILSVKMTSLEQQLKRLKTPQTEAFRQQKYKPSFLYDRKEAAGIDCDTHLRLAKKGFKKLLKLNPDLEQYQDLFSEKSKEVERSILHQDENDQLSKRIRKFIHNSVVPFFMLNDCHETLEYLIYKYQVHNYQTNDLLCALLPYHETRLFARALQVINDFDTSLWGWLKPYKKEGVSVPKQRIIDVLSSRSKLPLVSLLGDKLIEINRDSSKAGIYTSFYTTTMMCVLERDLDENFYQTFAQHVDKAIKKSNNSNLFMAGLVLIGYLAYTQELEESYLKRMITKLTKAHAKLREKEEKNKDLLDEYYKKVLAVINHQLDQHQKQSSSAPAATATSQQLITTPAATTTTVRD